MQQKEKVLGRRNSSVFNTETLFSHQNPHACSFHYTFLGGVGGAGKTHLTSKLPLLSVQAVALRILALSHCRQHLASLALFHLPQLPLASKHYPSLNSSKQGGLAVSAEDNELISVN